MRQESLREVGRPELVLRADAEDVASAVDEVPAPVAPVPAHAGGACPDLRAPELPDDDAVGALDPRRHLGGVGKREPGDHEPPPGPNERAPRHAEVAERVVHPERLVGGGLPAKIVHRGHDPVPAPFGVHLPVQLRPSG